MVRFGMGNEDEIHPGKNAVILRCDCAAQGPGVGKVELVAHCSDQAGEEAVSWLKSGECTDGSFVRQLCVFGEALASVIHVASELGLHMIEIVDQTLNGFDGPLNLR